jgi:hypothetical protein
MINGHFTSRHLDSMTQIRSSTMIRKVIRLDYEFASGKKKVSFETDACTNEECSMDIEKILTQLELTRNKISKIELLEIFE